MGASGGPVECRSMARTLKPFYRKYLTDLTVAHHLGVVVTAGNQNDYRFQAQGWDLGSEQPLWTHALPRDSNLAGVFVHAVPGRDLVLVGSRDRVELVEATTGKLLDALELKRDSTYDSFTALASPIGGGDRVAVGGRDGHIRLVDLAKRRVLRSLKGHSVGVASLAFHPDGQRLFSLDVYGEARCWDVKTYQCLAVLPTTNDRARPADSLRVLPDGRAIFAANDQFHLWDPVAGVERLKAWAPIHLAVLADGWASTDVVGNVSLWGPGGLKRYVGKGAPTAYHSGLEPLADGRLISGDDAGVLHLWDPATDTQAEQVFWQKCQSATATHAGTQVFASDTMGAAVLWDAATAKRGPVTWFTPILQAAVFTRDDLSLVTAATNADFKSGELVRYRVEGYETEWNVPLAVAGGKALVLSPGDAVAYAIGDDKVLRAHQVSDGKSLGEQSIGWCALAMAAPTQDEVLLALDSTIWHVRTPFVADQPITAKHVAAGDMEPELSLDGRWLLSAERRLLPGDEYTSHSIARASSLEAGTFQDFLGHEEDVEAVAFLPGDRVVTADHMGLLFVWELATGKQLFTWRCTPRVATLVTVPNLGFAVIDMTGAMVFFRVEGDVVTAMNEPVPAPFQKLVPTPWPVFPTVPPPAQPAALV